MGGKGGGTTITQRELTPEERKLISTQTRYIDSLQPAVSQLVNRGTAAMGGVINPNYGAMYQDAQYNLNRNMAGIDQLATGRLPSSYTNNKKDYYNQMYNNTFGSTLSNAAKRGIIGGSSLNKSIDSMQKNMNAQMSSDYTKDLQTQSGLLQQQQSSIMQPFQLGTMANQASFAPVSNYLGLASGQGSQGTQLLDAMGNLNNNRSAFVQSSGKGLF